MGTFELNSEQREFFKLVNRAIFANPFSTERSHIDGQIAGLFPDMSSKSRIESVIREVKERIQRMTNAGGCNINDYSGEDHQILKNALIFDFFHSFLDHFDRLILEQIHRGDQSLSVDFFDGAYERLKCWGYSDREILHYFALSYQIRRAYYFIDRSLVGRSSSMQALRESLWNNVFTFDIELYNTHLVGRMEDFSTIILGETGTGKGTAASAIGRSGYIPFDGKQGCFKESFTSSFIPINLTQFPATLIESELFGHRKGAFTGAIDDYVGIFQRCSPYGAIFLDEIGEASPPIQIKLLKVLDEREFSPIGSHKQQRFKGRIIAATNRPLHEISNNTVLRSDFYYRLCSDVIIVPPLRQRIREEPGELEDLVRYTVHRIAGDSAPELLPMVLEAMKQQVGMSYPWPGNVRELGQCVRQLILRRTYSPGPVKGLSGEHGSLNFEACNLDARELLQKYCLHLYGKHGTYAQVARITNLDRRTVKAYIDLDTVS